jgi:hypothetical protein
VIKRLPNLLGLVLAAFPIILWGLVLPSDSKQGTFINPRLVALYALLLFVFFAGLLHKNNLKESLRGLRLPVYFYALAAYLIIVCLSSITSPNPGIAWFGLPTSQEGALYLIALALLFACYARFKVPGLMSVYAVITFAAALLTLAQFLGFRPLGLLLGGTWDTAYPIGTTAYRGHLGGMFAFLSLLPLYAFYDKPKTPFFWLWIIAGNVGLALTTNASATLACAVCLAIYLAVTIFTTPSQEEGTNLLSPRERIKVRGESNSFRSSLWAARTTRAKPLPLIPAFSPREKGQRQFRHALVVVAIFATSIYAVPKMQQPVNTFLVNHHLLATSLNAGGHSRTRTLRIRLLFWKAAFHMWQAKPWLGWGDQQFNDNIFAFSSKADGDAIFRLQMGLKPDTKLTRIGDTAGYLNKDGEYGLHRFTIKWPHNIIMEQLEAHGILGLLAYLAFFVTLLFSVFLRAKGRGIVAALPYFGYFIYLTAWFYTVSVTPLAWIMLGALVYDLQHRAVPAVRPEEKEHEKRVGNVPLSQDALR